MADTAATKVRNVTLADLCQAIYSQELPATQDGDWYVVRRHDVKTLANRLVHQSNVDVMVQAS